MSANLRIMLPGVALIGVTYGLARFAYGLFLPAMRADVALTPTMAGLISGGSYVGFCIAIVAAALFAERLGPRNAATLAGAVAMAGTAAIALAPTPAVLGGAVLLAGASTGLSSPPLAEAVAASVAAATQGRANTLINSGSSAGVLLSGPIALAYTGAWREAYLVFAGIAAVVTLWSWWALPACGRRRGGGAPPLTLRAFRRPAAVRLALCAFSVGAASAAYWTFAGTALVDVGGLHTSASGTAWVVIGLAGFAGGAAGDLARRFGLGPVTQGSLLALAAAMLATGLRPGMPAVAYGAAAGFGAAYVMLTGLLLVWGVETFADRPAVGLALPFLMIAVGHVAGAPLAGAAVQALGIPAALAGFAGIAVVATLAGPPRPAGTDAPPADRDAVPAGACCTGG